MQLNKIFDPRDNLEKARRKELFRFAQANNIAGITDEMPATIMRRLLRQRGLTNIAIPNRTLGLSEPRGGKPQAAQPQFDGPAREVNADDDLMRQWAQQSRAPRAPETIQELRAECKKRGIKLSRTDNVKTLKEKLDGKNAA